ncbi:hypothetical protein AGMMS49938_03740 [Fibrobacterales bacterium]|nr:hypothetical protein AGMMS49938_03740 [Fibrobacterales bacterium]
MKLFFVSVMFFFAFAFAEEQDTSAVVKDTSETSVIEILQRNPITYIISLPFQYVIQPTVEFLLYPAIPPLIYISRENIIEKGLNVISFGSNANGENNQMLYPTLNLKPGSSSNIGLSYRHRDLFFQNDYFVLNPIIYINADWETTLRYQKRKILETSFYSNFIANYKEDGDNSFRFVNDREYLYSDSSATLFGSFGFDISENWGMEFAAEADFYRFDIPNISDSVVLNNEKMKNLGFYQHFKQFPLSATIAYNSLDEPYAATRGNKFSFKYTYTPVSDYNGSDGHNYHAVESRLINYTLLGNRSYFMTTKEVLENRERLKRLSFAEAIKILNPINIRENILERKILVTQLRFRAMFEENNGLAPFTAMGKLGSNFPLRAYSDGYFTAPVIAGISAEYRWAVDKYADALIFDEYGIFGDSPNSLKFDNLRNSWGIGFRVRTPSFFIMRFAVAFHGLHGVAITLTTRADYE